MNAILVFLCDFLNTYLFFLFPKCKNVELVFFLSTYVIFFVVLQNIYFNNTRILLICFALICFVFMLQNIFLRHSFAIRFL